MLWIVIMAETVLCAYALMTIEYPGFTPLYQTVHVHTINHSLIGG